MVYRLVRFNLGSGKLEAARNIFDDLVPKISAQPGCKGVTTFGDEASGNYGWAILWESTEASNAARAVIGPQLSKHLADNNASSNPFSNEQFEVLHFKVNECHSGLVIHKRRAWRVCSTMHNQAVPTA